MGITYADIILKNSGGISKAEDGIIKESEIRQAAFANDAKEIICIIK